ncbi:MAG: hypothetical protein M1832_005729 [Thelocarpon impressellum]|nr:MAG: hypothetical protein M1832_005729 [Thelocarpon impressellum]
MRHPVVLLACLASCLPRTLAIFEDEAYHTDYHYALLGLPQPHSTFFHRPQAASKASLLYTLSEKLVLGAVNPKDGSLVWRQSLASSTISTPGFLRAGENEALVVSAVGGQVKAWDALDGKLAWGNDFADGDAADLEVIESGEAAETAGAKDSVALFGKDGHGTVRRLSGDTGKVVWEFQDKSGDIPFQVSSSASSIFLVTLHGAGRTGYKIRVTSLNPMTGKRTGQYTLSSDGDVAGPSSVLFVGANSAAPIIAWTDKSKKVLKVNFIGSNHITSLNIDNAGGEDITKIIIHAPHLIKSRPHFLAHYETVDGHWADVFHVDLAASSISKAYSLPRLAGKGVFSTSTQDANVYFTRITEAEIIIVSSASHGVLERSPVAMYEGNGEARYPIHAVSEVVAKPGASYAVRSAVLLSDGMWELVRNGEPSWTRPEALAGAVAAEWAELREEEDLARQLEVEGHQDVLSAYLHRLRRHIKDLEHFPGWLQALPTRILSGFTHDDSLPSDSRLHRDSFGFRKLVIIATERGRLFALDTGAQGRIVWSIEAADLAPEELWKVRGIFVDNAQGSISVKGAKGDALVVETVTGKVIHKLPAGSSPPLDSAAFVEGPAGKFIMDVYEDGHPGDIPSAQSPREKATVVVRGRDDVIRGLRFVGQGKVLQPATVWEFSPPTGARIGALTMRPPHDPVASIGRVLGDRSVLYKFLNPSLLLITTVDDALSTATVYLLDSITGDILYSTTHDDIDPSRPVSAAMSENWFVYSFWGDSSSKASGSMSKGFKLVVTELYESDMANDRGPLGSSGNYSSVRGSSAGADVGKPHVISQAFDIPEEIGGMTVTQTRQGITSRSILATLRASKAIVAIPKGMLDPRRPSGRDLTPSEKEEGLGKYAPSLGFNPEWVISHKREVVGTERIITSPALLESTSLVFAFGLDVFGTRVTPSLAFDILGKGFGKTQLLLTVVALGGGVVLLAPMASRLSA